MQLSIWPGGADTNAKGTVDWAGGPIDWNSPDIQSFGYDFATFGQVEIECYNATSGPGTNKKTSYTYNDARGTNDTIVDGDKGTVLKSFAGTGLDMDAGGSGSSASPSGTQTAAGAVASVPGGTASGPGSAPAENGGSDGGTGTGTQTTGSASCQATGFSQDCTGGSSSTGNSGKSAGVRLERTLGAGALAVVVAVAGVFLL